MAATSTAPRPQTARKPPSDNSVQECKSHCATCGSHFSSDEAFDAHRRGDYSALDGRYCEEPADATYEAKDGRRLPSLELVRADGRCLIGTDEPAYGVNLWRRARVDRRAVTVGV